VLGRELRSVLGIILFLCLTAPAVAAEAPVEGRASVIDGDTFDIQRTRIRLHGVDAPEAAQTCRDADGKDWRCGQRAALALAERLGSAPVRCEPLDRDAYGRTVARCFSAGVDINAWLVENGWAVAYRSFSRTYETQEATARAGRRGIWQGSFTTPERFRAARRAPAPVPQAAPDPACAIKGNRNAAGACIYHLPGSRDYARTVVTAGRGERYFCTVAEAVAAGCRPPR
jgi:endonuclease YncB( thermonuclease family)